MPKNKRSSEGKIHDLRRQAVAYLEKERTTKFTYSVSDINKRYNGNGDKGTGGPKGEWLRPAVDEYIRQHHPELQQTFIDKLFSDLGWQVIFTAPYWADSQPIELVWAYIKNWVSLQWYPGRSMKDLRRQILLGMYGGHGLYDAKVHAPVDSALATKLINHVIGCVKTFAEKDEVLKDEDLF